GMALLAVSRPCILGTFIMGSEEGCPLIWNRTCKRNRLAPARNAPSARHDPSVVMAGLVTASRGYPTCGTQLVRNSGKAELRCHPRLCLFEKQDVDARHKAGHDGGDWA